MTDHSAFLRVATATPRTVVADPAHNLREIKALAEAAHKAGVQILVFPELSLSAYTAADLLTQDQLIRGLEAALGDLAVASEAWPSLLLAVGSPLEHNYRLYDAAILIQGGRVLAAIPKTHLENTGEAQESRWFSTLSPHTGTSCGIDRTVTVEIAGQAVPLGRQIVDVSVDSLHLSIGVEIGSEHHAPIPPSSELALAGAMLILNTAASSEQVTKPAYRRLSLQAQSAATNTAYIYANAGPGESTTDLVYSGHSLILENGEILAETEPFTDGAASLNMADIDLVRLAASRKQNTAFRTGQVEAERFTHITAPVALESVPWTNLERKLSPHPFVPEDPKQLADHCREIYQIQAQGLAKRMRHTNSKYAVIGISGGLDSTLALLVITEAYKLLGLPMANIVAVTMPGFGTTDHTYKNALALMECYGVTIREISIREPVLQHFRDIGHDPELHDITYENSQARERTQILMDIANQVGGLVIGTGDLSELALGWCTYNGDHMSMYDVNASVPKTLIRPLIAWQAVEIAARGGQMLADILASIVATPISPELLPPDKDGQIAQHTEASTGPYELHDFFLYYFMRHGADPVRLYRLAVHAFRESGRYSDAQILKWLRVFIRRFINQQFKRSAMPDGPKVGSVALSPRGDWRMPSDASAAAWLSALDSLD